MQDSEATSAMAVRCACTAIHLRKFLIRNHKVADQVRRDLKASATLLEDLSSELEEFERTQGGNAHARGSSASGQWRAMTIVSPRNSAPVPM